MKETGWTVDYDAEARVLYITSPRNRSAEGVETKAAVFRFANDDGALVGVTILDVPNRPIYGSDEPH